MWNMLKQSLMLWCTLIKLFVKSLIGVRLLHSDTPGGTGAEADTVSITRRGCNWRRCVPLNLKSAVQSRVKSPPPPSLYILTYTHAYNPADKPINCSVGRSQEALMKLLIIFMCVVACKQGLHWPAGGSVSTLADCD